MMEDVSDDVRKALEYIKDQHMFQKAYLKPIEIRLRAEKDKLPDGLEMALKDTISSNKFKTTRIECPTAEEMQTLSYEELIEKNYDNLLALMKDPAGIEVAMCVCMYSEDKRMLKSTLAGVSENIDYFVRSGISTDKIGVFVIMDGIEKVDSSVIEYFDELERESDIHLAQDVEPMGLKDLIQNREQELYEENVININNFLYSDAELLDRQERRFSTRIEEYMSIKNLASSIEKMKWDKGLTYETLDPRVQRFFVEVAKLRRKEEYGEDDEQLKDKDANFFVENYANDVVKSRPLIMQALIEAKRYCDEYINTRDSLSLLNYFRTNVFLTSTQQEMQKRKRAGKLMGEEVDDLLPSPTSRMNLFLCTKYKNSGKLSSHNWFFNGFCKELRPRYAILLDVGLRPEKNALYKMYKYMVNNRNVGGVCGYMGLRIERVQDELGYNSELNEEDDIDCISRTMLKFTDIQRAQQLEYHFAHMIDKPFESQFKFIHVLPGAFSAYNMKALETNNLLDEYFRSLDEKLTGDIPKSRYSAFDVVMKVIMPDPIHSLIWPVPEDCEEQKLYNENIYLAEDRILCMGIHKNGMEIAFVPDAYAWVDPIKNTHTLLGQRKRWINGSMFAFDKVKRELSKAVEFELALQIQMWFLTAMNSLAYIAPAMFLFTVSIAMQAFMEDVLLKYFSTLIPSELMVGFVYVVSFVYVMMLASIIFFSMHLTNKHKKFVPYIYACTTMLGIFSIIVFLILVVDIFRGSPTFIIQNPAFTSALPLGQALLDSMRFIILSTMMMYAFPVFLYAFLYKRFNFVVDTVFSALSFLYFSPTYLCTLNIYALCRINDISWGTKGLDSSVSTKTAQLDETWRIIRLIHVGKYVFWNIIAGVIILTMGGSYVSRFYLTFFIMIILAFSLFFKVATGSLYLINYYMTGRIPDPPLSLNVGDNYFAESRVDSLFKLTRDAIQDQIKRHLVKIEHEIKRSGDKGLSLVIWGGKSKIIEPGKRKVMSDSRRSDSKRTMTNSKSKTRRESYARTCRDPFSSTLSTLHRSSTANSTSTAQKTARASSTPRPTKRNSKRNPNEIQRSDSTSADRTVASLTDSS